MEILPQQFRVPELYGDYWYNSDPIPVSALKGYVILINFWDYTNQKSIRALPYIREWNRRYADLGLVTIGVHTPEFPFGRDPINVRAAIDQLSIRYPVVSDNDYIIWGVFKNLVWPTTYLIDRHGFIRYVQAGEGSYEHFERALQSLVVEAGYHGDLPLVMDPVREEDRPGAVLQRATSEILAGWQRGTIGNVEGYAPESVIHYEDPGYYVGGRLYLSGDWLSSREYVKLENQGGMEGRLSFTYQGVEVNAVIKPEGEKKFQVFAQQDGCNLVPSNRGADIRIDEEGRSYFLVDTARNYNIVRQKEFGEHNLRLITRSNGFTLYAVTFVSAAITANTSSA
jgi:hypothetical protein